MGRKRDILNEVLGWVVNNGFLLFFVFTGYGMGWDGYYERYDTTDFNYEWDMNH